jgi:hypothetical protein
MAVSACLAITLAQIISWRLFNWLGNIKSFASVWEKFLFRIHSTGGHLLIAFGILWCATIALFSDRRAALYEGNGMDAFLVAFVTLYVLASLPFVQSLRRLRHRRIQSSFSPRAPVCRQALRVLMIPLLSASLFWAILAGPFTLGAFVHSR